MNRRQAANKNVPRTPVAKADIALSDLTGGIGAGYLTAQNAKQFMLLLVKESILLGDINVVPMLSHTYNIDKLRFATGVLKAATEASALGVNDRSKPNLSRSQIIAKPFKAEVRLDDFVLEDSIEGPGLANTIRTALAQAIARDMESIVISSDTANAALAPELKQFDGLFKRVSTNTFNALDTNTNKAILRAMMRLMPKEFLRRDKIAFYTSVNSDADYRDQWANRQTSEGDSYFSDYKPAFYNGAPIIPCPIWPEDIGTGSHCTSIVLTDPKNLFLGIWRRLRVEVDKSIREGVVSIVASLRMGFNIAEETATVKATNVKTIE